MPKDNIDRAIKKGTGELGGEIVEELFYEGIVPPGAQIIVKCLTDNKNRSGAAVRHLFTKNGGAFSTVMWNFTQFGVIRVAAEDLKLKNINADDLELELIDEGISDFQKAEEGITIYTEVKDLHKVAGTIEKKNLKVTSAEIEYVSKEKVELEEGDKEKFEKILEALEDNEDVSDYYTNLAD
jgi:YebC/PmpR family DNA-binding regulatory protein